MTFFKAEDEVPIPQYDFILQDNHFEELRETVNSGASSECTLSRCPYVSAGQDQLSLRHIQRLAHISLTVVLF